MILRPEPLTALAFAPFGDVIETRGAAGFAINDGMATRFDNLANLDPGQGGRLTVNVFRGKPFAWPVRLTLLERHPQGSQAFMPLSGRPFLAVVATGETAPDPATVRAFLARGDQGVNYRRGIWHHPLLALEAESDFLVLDRGADPDNCEVVPLAGGARVERQTAEAGAK